MKAKNEIVIYQADELTKVEVQIYDETVWLSQEQMALLFGRNRVAITQHIGNIFKESELQKEVVCKEFLLTTHQGAIKGKTQLSRVKLYNRFLIIDKREVYHIGASIKDLGKKWFAFIKIDDFTDEIVKRLEKYDN